MPPSCTHHCHLPGYGAGSWGAGPCCHNCAEGVREHRSDKDLDMVSSPLLDEFPGGSCLDHHGSGISLSCMDDFPQTFHGTPSADYPINRSYLVVWFLVPSNWAQLQFRGFTDAREDPSHPEFLAYPRGLRTARIYLPQLPHRGFRHDSNDFWPYQYTGFMDAGEDLSDDDLATIIQHISALESGAHWFNPASKISVDAMPLSKFSRQNSQADDCCAVCQEAYEVGEEVREMPCKHVYHSGCILPWLAKNRSCPLCRHEMPAEGEKAFAGWSDTAIEHQLFSNPTSSVETNKENL